MNRNLVSIPIGIIDVFWDYEDEDCIKKAFYILSVSNVNDKIEFTNNYYFLEEDLCVRQENTKTQKCNFKIIDSNVDNRIKIQLLSDVLFVSREQLKVINEAITKFQIDHISDIDIKNSNYDK